MTSQQTIQKLSQNKELSHATSPSTSLISYNIPRKQQLDHTQADREQENYCGQQEKRRTVRQKKDSATLQREYRQRLTSEEAQKKRTAAAAYMREYRARKRNNSSDILLSAKRLVGETQVEQQPSRASDVDQQPVRASKVEQTVMSDVAQQPTDVITNRSAREMTSTEFNERLRHRRTIAAQNSNDYRARQRAKIPATATGQNSGTLMSSISQHTENSLGNTSQHSSSVSNSATEISFVAVESDIEELYIKEELTCDDLEMPGYSDGTTSVNKDMAVDTTEIDIKGEPSSFGDLKMPNYNVQCGETIQIVKEEPNRLYDNGISSRKGTFKQFGNMVSTALGVLPEELTDQAKNEIQSILIKYQLAATPHKIE